MKETLRKKLKDFIDEIEFSCKLLNENYYKSIEEGELYDATKSDIKWRQLKAVSQRLNKILNINE